MNRNIRFYPNHEDNQHCSQAVFRSLFNYFFDKELSWEEIDQIAKTIQGKAAWTIPEHIELARRGVEIINIEPFDYEKFYRKGIPYLISNFEEKTANYYLEKSNLLLVRDMIPAFLSLVKHETRKATLTDIDGLLEKGYLIGAEINSRILNKKSGFNLHYILIKNKDGEKYIINDPGGTSSPPWENRVILKSDFVQALGESGANGEVSALRKRDSSTKFIPPLAGLGMTV